MDLEMLNEKARRRVCQVCGEEFLTDENGPALAKYADHSVIHQPTSAQWSEAYRKIKQGNDRKKEQEG